MKFAKADQAYFDQRKLVSERSGPRELWSIIDHWALYCGVGNLARSLAVADLAREQIAVPGHFAEFGSWRGANLMLLAKVLRIYDPVGPKQVYCFDSFEGLTEFSQPDGGSEVYRGQYRGSFEELREMVELYGLTDDIVFQVGKIEATLPALLAAETALSFSLVYCDTDLYTSTKQILVGLHPRLSLGGVFVLDEWNYTNFPGEGVAVREFLEEHGDCYSMESVQSARQPSLILRKQRMG